MVTDSIEHAKSLPSKYLSTSGVTDLVDSCLAPFYMMRAVGGGNEVLFWQLYHYRCELGGSEGCEREPRFCTGPRCFLSFFLSHSHGSVFDDMRSNSVLIPMDFPLANKARLFPKAVCSVGQKFPEALRFLVSK